MRGATAALLALLLGAGCQAIDTGPKRGVALDVPFVPGSWAVASDAGPVLDATAGALADSRLRGSRYLVRAHAPAGGPPGEALALARLRAAAVVDQLAARGMPRERLEAQGMVADLGGERVEILRR